jgi:Ca-activated chloride channel family protein
VASQVAVERAVVVLAMDTSLSMEAADVAPSCLAAAQDAARAFVENVPDGVRVGLVGFDNGARLLVPPTDKVAVIERAVDRLALGEGTAIGEAVFTSLDAIAEALQADPVEDDQPAAPAAEDGPQPAVVVLLSDGENTVGRSNDEAAAAAAAQGRPVYTVAVGTDTGQIMLPDGSSQPVPVNRPALADLADRTGARSFTAYNSDELRQVYEDLGRTLAKEPVQKDISGWFVAGAMGLLALAALGSLLWFARLP